MNISGLDNRLLLMLAKKWKEKGTSGPYRTSTIYRGYPDLPEDYTAGQLKILSERGLITFTSDRKKFYLANKGTSYLRSFISTDRWNSVGI